MPYDFLAQQFTEELLVEVQDFHCGSEPWQVEVSEWIKNPNLDDCAVEWMRRGTRVWLYRTERGAILGYGSLGKSNWRLREGSPREPVSVIPAFAVGLQFQGEPRGLPWAERYSARMMGDLIARAAELEPKILGLFVDKQNARAISFYERIGFRALPDEGGAYAKMYLDLS